MEQYNLLERTPVIYGPSSVKVLFFEKKGKEPNFRMHWHERIEILRVIDGELKVNLGTKTVTAKKDEFIIIPPRMPHKARPISTQNTVPLCLISVIFITIPKSEKLFCRRFLREE